MPRALITGVTGQDGSYLAEFLVGKGYEAWGLVRDSHPEKLSAVAHLLNDNVEPAGGLNIVEGDLRDSESLRQTIGDIRPDEIYNLAAQSFLPSAFEDPLSTIDVNGLGPVRILEAVVSLNPECKLFQAASAEMFGNAKSAVQNEQTEFKPKNPYATAKTLAYWSIDDYRQRHDVFACNGILFNHDSPRRSTRFVTRKITTSAARIKLGLQASLELGNIDTQRDWGFAGDFVEAMWLMLQQDSATDYVVATGVTHTVRDFLDVVFGYLDLNWVDYVRTDSSLIRKSETIKRQGDITKAKQILGWEPRHSFSQMAEMMVKHDLAQLSA